MFLSEQLLQSALGPGPKHTSVSEISALVANSTSGEEVGTTVGVIENDMGSFIPQEWQVPLLVLVRRSLLPQCALVVRMTDWIVTIERSIEHDFVCCPCTDWRNYTLTRRGLRFCSSTLTKTDRTGRIPGSSWPVVCLNHRQRSVNLQRWLRRQSRKRQ
jgi:hypothetical protein